MELPASTKRVVAAARRLGVEPDIRLFPDGTKTAGDAARAVGCDLGAIVKSLVFVVDDEPVLALIPGDRRLDAGKLAAAAGGRSCRRARLDEVRGVTGYAAGGTPPIGHDTAIAVYADPGLMRFGAVWVAGGTPTTVFPITPAELGRITGATWLELAEPPDSP